MRNARLDRLAAEVATMKRHQPTSRLKLYTMGEDIGQSTWAGGPVDCIAVPREAESITAWFASCNDWITNH